MTEKTALKTAMQPFVEARKAPDAVEGATVNIEVLTKHPMRAFVPATALGAGVDGHEAGDTAHIYTTANIAAMKSAGLRSLTYRLRTELGVETWHWNPRGHWSNAAHARGYWVSNATSRAPLTVSYGFRLPRRGNTIDQANNDGFSRLADGDTTTFWKSNPYLDAHFTGEPNARHPQWVVVDLGRRTPISHLKLWWGHPFATRYHIEYWNGTSQKAGENDFGHWQVFPAGRPENGRGGQVTIRLAAQPVTARYVRLVMVQSASYKSDVKRDIRDMLGYAIREIALGTFDGHGRFHDVMRHRRDRQQTLMYVSSTDSWHRAQDLDKATEQPGLDTVFRSGLSNGFPVLTPTGLLYDTPENASNELRFLRSRGYPVTCLELGEEADGQYIAPADYAALYAQWARRLRAFDNHIALGGPSFQTVGLDIAAWPERSQKQSWLERVLDYFRAHGQRQSFNFCSFEWYPFDNVCAPTQPQLLAAPGRLRRAVARLRLSFARAGWRRDTPLLMSEYGYSAFAAQAEVDLAGALFNAETVGDFLQMSGATSYLYGYEPDELLNEMSCAAPIRAWGNNMMLLGDNQRRVKHRTATYFAAWLIAHQWLGQAGQRHQLFATSNDFDAARNDSLVRSFAVRRPDGLWSILLINKDEKRAHRIHLRFHGSSSSDVDARTFRGAVTLFQFSGKQYQWHPRGADGFPAPALFPQRSTRMNPKNANDFSAELPPYSLCVVRGQL